MARKNIKRRQKIRPSRRAQKRQTNWLVVGAVGVGAVVLFALLYLTLQGRDPLSLATYCQNNPDACVTLGDADAPVTVVEVSDYGCSHCRDFHEQTFAELIAAEVDSGRVYWVALPFALFDERLPVANASLCAAEQDAYFEFSEEMFAKFSWPDNLTPAGAVLAAESVDLDMDAFEACVDDSRYIDTIQSNRAAARQAGITGTPTFIINGFAFSGDIPLATFQSRIENALQAGGS